MLKEKKLVERHWPFIISNSISGIAIVDESGKIIYANHAFESITEYTNEELTGKMWMSITHPDDVDVDTRSRNELKTSGDHSENYQMVKRYISKTGKIVWVKLKVLKLMTPEGEFEAFLSQVVMVQDPEMTKAFNIHTKEIADLRIRMSEIQFQDDAAKILVIIKKYWMIIAVFLILGGILGDRASEFINQILLLGGT